MQQIHAPCCIRAFLIQSSWSWAVPHASFPAAYSAELASSCLVLLVANNEKRRDETRKAREKRNTLIHGTERNGTEWMVKLEEAQKMEAKSRHVSVTQIARKPCDVI